MFLLSKGFWLSCVSRRLVGLCCWILLACGMGMAHAAGQDEFVISFHSMPTFMDPHRARVSANVAVNSNVFDTLFQVVDDDAPNSLILESWKAESDHVWLFRLKQGIRFHDGSPLTSKDVVYSFDRIRELPDSDYATFIKRWERYEAVDDYTVRIVTQQPNANLLRDVGRIFIIKHRDTPLTTENFVAEKGYIGTGAYRLDEVTPEGDIRLSANPDYHGNPVFLKKIRITRIADPKARVQALQDNKIQLAEGLTEAEVALLDGVNTASVVRSPTHRLLHFHLDMFRDQSPFVRGAEGEVLKENPLKNIKVRRALSLAINRDVLVNEVLRGQGIAAGQYMLPGVLGHIPGMEADPWSPDEARRLLAEAGYPKGFQLTLHGSNNRYLKDKEVVEAVAAMWTAVGVTTTPVTLDRKAFFAASTKHEYSASMLGVSTDGNLQAFLEVLLHTQTPELGLFNDGRYSNSEVDALIDQAGQQFNQVSRIRSLAQASELALNDYGIIPLFFEKAVWVMRTDVGGEFWPTRMGYTVAADVRQASRPAE